MDNRGFTLVELLIVIAILGILAAVAIPQFSRYRNNAYCSQIVSDAAHAFQAMEAYYSQNLTYGSLSDTVFTPTQDINVIVLSTTPLVVQASDDKGRCPLGVYTLSQNQGKGEWSGA
jgi:type IV pilus assembly protein PilA